MPHSSDRLVWIDCEMTGLDLRKDELVEVAVVVTDFELTPLHPGLDVVIRPTAQALDGMGEFVREMHTSSGLIDEIPGGLSLAEAETTVLEYVRRYAPDRQKAPLAGNTIGTDRMFLSAFMPHVDSHLHYRNVDVSSIKELARRWYPRVYYNAPAKQGGHRALADILESIRELDYYRRAVFPELPGPDTAECQRIAASVVDSWAPRM